jgi:ABC-type branched-subunit amino acid transport system ATPase component
MALLEAEGITVRFGGNVATDDVDLTVGEGRITGLIGPNGAGKTTTFNALCGLQPMARGSITLGGQDITKLPAHKRARLGLARTFQRLEVFTLLSVRENILAGAEIRKTWARRAPQGTRDDDRTPEQMTHELIERLGLADVAEERVDSLPTGRARLVELGRALANRPRLILLDEVSSGLNETETEAMAEVLKGLASNGIGILLVEHDMSLVMSTCDDINVLDFGQIIAVGTPAEIQANERVQEAYLGSDKTSHAKVAKRELPPEDVPLLDVRDVSAGYGDFDVLDGVSFSVRTGEVFALLGPNGAGKSTTLKVISGLLAPTSGTVALCGRSVTGADADELSRAGLCLVPEGKGIFPNLTVAENLQMATFTGTDKDVVEERAYARFPRLAERRSQVAGTLSGGEQQMLSMARALATDPSLLLLDELSMGLAPIIVQGLYEQVAEIAREGLSIVVVEQFAHEVLGVADTAAIMLHGRIRRVGPPEQIAEELTEAYLAGSAG